MQASRPVLYIDLICRTSGFLQQRGPGFNRRIGKGKNPKVRTGLCNYRPDDTIRTAVQTRGRGLYKQSHEMEAR